MSEILNIRLLSTIFVAALLASCAAPRPAPVSDVRPPAARPDAVKPAEPSAGTEAAKPADSLRVHVVQRSETLYSIAFQNGIDIRELAAWNNIVNPALIRVGDTLRLSAPDAPVAALPQPGMPVATPLVITPAVTPAATPAGSAPAATSDNTALMKVEPKAGRVPYSDAAYAKMSADAAPATGLTIAPAVPSLAVASIMPAVSSDSIAWAWPVKGKVLSTFTEISKGIDITGSKGAPVFAAAAGKVIHSSAVIRGYGRLIIIKHNDTWLSAYAHNEKLLVTEGEEIKKGQKIAEMGSSDADSVKLHFEIRNKGKPVDPLKFLPPQ